uniref:Uncharacterized protein n=1 Tax=Brassica oleracea var. oleracea TaxID=109376 RepID=A0A0D3ASX2_BRAOL
MCKGRTEKEDGRAVPSSDTEGLERIRPFMDKSQVVENLSSLRGLKAKALESHVQSLLQVVQEQAVEDGWRDKHAHEGGGYFQGEPFMDKVGTRLIHPALGQAVKPEACVPSCPFISKGDAPVSLDFTCLD